MDFIDRYVYAVERHLPRAQRSDIAQELTDVLRTQQEERENELGHALTPGETASMLSAFGHPLLVASRYWKQQQLIGPLLLPFYWNALRIAVVSVLCLDAASLIVNVLNHPQSVLDALALAWGLAWSTLFLVCGVVTLIVALVERFAARSPLHELRLGRWDPRRLPAVPGAQPVSRPALALELVVATLCGLWFLDLPWFRQAVHVVLGPAAPAATTPFVFGPGWHHLFALVPWFAGVQIVLVVTLLVRPQMARVRATGLVAIASVWLYGVCSALLQRPAVELAPSTAPVAQYATALPVLNVVADSLIAVLGFLCITVIVKNVRFLSRGVQSRVLAV